MTTNHPEDLPDELISLARAIVRKCRTPGRYAVEFTVTSHKCKIENALVAKIEPLYISKKHNTRRA